MKEKVPKGIRLRPLEVTITQLYEILRWTSKRTLIPGHSVRSYLKPELSAINPPDTSASKDYMDDPIIEFEWNPDKKQWELITKIKLILR